MNIIVTGGAGFIGSNFIRYWLERHNDNIFNYDYLTYAGNLENLCDISNDSRYYFFEGDINDISSLKLIVKNFKPDVIVNFAAETHNSYAIKNPSTFYRTNLMGTQCLLEICRQNNIRFHHISTCEVYGDTEINSRKKFKEDHPLLPNTPYSSSKACADLAVMAYFKTYGVPVTISRCCNNYGPYQFPEKLIPLFITNIADEEKITLYKHSCNKREWLHVFDHCTAIDLIINKGKIGEIYNVGSGLEKSIEEISDIIIKHFNLDSSVKEYVEDRPGHDRRYLLDSSKIVKELGWYSIVPFDHGISNTITWYMNNEKWWEPLKEKRFINENEWYNNF
ncbi:MAG: dTDP-glucose 4,6-dehydratase [Atribacterota bacterium]